MCEPLHHPVQEVGLAVTKAVLKVFSKELQLEVLIQSHVPQQDNKLPCPMVPEGPHTISESGFFDPDLHLPNSSGIFFLISFLAT